MSEINSPGVGAYVASTVEQRNWAIKGFELKQQLLEGHITFVAEYTVAEQSVQYPLAIPKDAIVKRVPVGRNQGRGDRKDELIFLRERTMIWQQILRPIHLGLIDTSQQSIPAIVSDTDLGGGITILALPASDSARAIPAS